MQPGGENHTPRASARRVSIRTDHWPEPDRVAMFREVYGGDGIRLDPRPGEPLRIDATLIVCEGLALLQGRRSPLRSEFADGSDRLILNLGGPALANQFGRELRLERGDAIALSGSDRGSMTTLRAGRIATIEFPDGGLLASPTRPARDGVRRIPQHSLPLRLLRGYLGALHASDWGGSAGPPELAIAHIHDLAALAVRAGDGVDESTTGRGSRAARLQAIKADVLARIEHDISLGELARRHRLSARYVGMLFESEGTSLTEFVREERLRRARSLLLSPRGARRRIAEIAYEVGFNDLSYFNRSFRRRFGRSPSEMRARGRLDS